MEGYKQNILDNGFTIINDIYTAEEVDQIIV